MAYTEYNYDNLIKTTKGYFNNEERKRFLYKRMFETYTICNNITLKTQFRHQTTGNIFHIYIFAYEETGLDNFDIRMDVSTSHCQGFIIPSEVLISRRKNDIQLIGKNLLFQDWFMYAAWRDSLNTNTLDERCSRLRAWKIKYSFESAFIYECVRDHILFGLISKPQKCSTVTHNPLLTIKSGKGILIVVAPEVVSPWYFSIDILWQENESECKMVKATTHLKSLYRRKVLLDGSSIHCQGIIVSKEEYCQHSVNLKEREKGLCSSFWVPPVPGIYRLHTMLSESVEHIEISMDERMPNCTLKNEILIDFRKRRLKWKHAQVEWKNTPMDGFYWVQNILVIDRSLPNDTNVRKHDPKCGILVRRSNDFHTGYNYDKTLIQLGNITALFYTRTSYFGKKYSYVFESDEDNRIKLFSKVTWNSASKHCQTRLNSSLAISKTKEDFTFLNRLMYILSRPKYFQFPVILFYGIKYIPNQVSNRSM